VRKNQAFYSQTSGDHCK